MTDTGIGHVDYTRIDVDRTASYAEPRRPGGRSSPAAGRGSGAATRTTSRPRARSPSSPRSTATTQAASPTKSSGITGPALALATDVGDEDSVKAMAARTLEAFGRIDILINNAAVFSKITMAPFWELPVEEWKAAMRVNITGSMLCARAVVPAMMEAGWGRIVNISSGTHAKGRPNYLHYITSKSAMVGMSRSMARELGPYGITVNTFWPGVMQTEIERPSVPRHMFKTMTQAQALPRQGTIHDLAKAMLFVCSDEAGYITGQNLVVDGGSSFI